MASNSCITTSQMSQISSNKIGKSVSMVSSVLWPFLKINNAESKVSLLLSCLSLHRCRNVMSDLMDLDALLSPDCSVYINMSVCGQCLELWQHKSRYFTLKLR